MAEVDIAGIEARDITNALNDRSVIDINFSIVHCGDWAFNRVGLSAFATHLYRVRAIQNRDIGISVGCDMECAVRFHASPVGGSIATNGHIIAGCGGTRILRCHVLFLVALELPTLVALVAVHHGQIAGGIDSGVFVSAEIFAPHIHDPKLFGLHILIVLELFQNTSCTPCQRILTVAEHRCHLIWEQVTQLTPQFGVSSVKHILCADGISILIAISQSQTTFVIIAHGGIVIVVKAEVPVNQIAGVWEHVLCTVIDHGVALSKQIMENSRIQIEVILEMCLEFLIIRIHHPVLSCDPRLFASLDLFLSAGRIVVTELKGVVAVPSFL